uniref:THAP-type domain-containing protein n=1 Tax=Pristionchus pacificus TaxID=54126 RepID=A0A8R1UNN4_PRIPA
MVNKCGVCGKSGATKSFPANSLPHKQGMWMSYLNLAEEGDKLLIEWREKLGQKHRIYWCSSHFNGDHPDPIDVRFSSTTVIAFVVHYEFQLRPPTSSASNDMPLLSRKVNTIWIFSHDSNRGYADSQLSLHDTQTETTISSINCISSQRTEITIHTVSREKYETMYNNHFRVIYRLAKIQLYLTGKSLIVQSFQSISWFPLDNCYPCSVAVPREAWNRLIRLTLSSTDQRLPQVGMRSLPRSNMAFSTPTGWSLLRGKREDCMLSAHHWSSIGSRLFGNGSDVRYLLPLSQRLDDFASEMGLAIPAQRTMHNYIADLIGPAVDNVYVNHMKEVLNIVRNTTHDKGIDISMDGRYDSPGFSASNCTISAVDLKTNLVIMVVNKNKKEKEIGGVSGRMEKEGVRQGLMRIQALQFKDRMLREDAQFKDIKHLLDFWHLIKPINHDLREIAKKKSCPNIKYWQRQIINHGYYVHYKHGKSRERGLKYWISLLAHVTGRHKHFAKVPFLHGIKRCRHKALQTSPAHQIKRGSEEYHALKAIVMKRKFMAGFLRVSPKKNTSPNECYNSIINLYAPKIRACSPKWYEERIKLTTLHFNTLALLNMLDMRVETGNCSVTVNGRQGDTVKRKMAKAKHEWRKQAWEEIPKVIERMRLQQFLKKNNAPSDRGYILALQEEEGEGEEGEGEDGAESDVSVELGGGLYGEPVDSDQEPLMDAIELSDAESEEEEEEEGSSGSEWEEGETGRIAMEKGGRGRGRGRGGRGRGLGRAQSRVTADTSTALTCTLSDQEEVQGCTEEGKGDQRKKGTRAKGGRKTVKDDSSSNSDSEKPPLKKGRRKGLEGNNKLWAHDESRIRRELGGGVSGGRPLTCRPCVVWRGAVKAG